VCDSCKACYVDAAGYSIAETDPRTGYSLMVGLCMRFVIKNRFLEKIIVIE
jgi:hypothetical protein